MIDLNFGLWWSGSKLSYLRYLTFKTLRHFHPHSRIQLFIGNKFKTEGHNWNREQQEFESDNRIKVDYIDKLKDLDVEIKRVDFFPTFAPNYQSDFFRWWYLKTFGGFYLDTDQIVLKSFDTLPLKDHKIIYCSYGNYSPVGIIGATKDSKTVDYITKMLPKHYNPNDYNSLGPWMFRSVLQTFKTDEGYNAPAKYFYPIPFSDHIPKVYSGEFEIPHLSYALHWFGGLEASQGFNKRYTEEFDKKSDDTISRFLREKELL